MSCAIAGKLNSNISADIGEYVMCFGSPKLGEALFHPGAALSGDIEDVTDMLCGLPVRMLLLGICGARCWLCAF